MSVVVVLGISHVKIGLESTFNKFINVFLFAPWRDWDPFFPVILSDIVVDFKVFLAVRRSLEQVLEIVSVLPMTLRFVEVLPVLSVVSKVIF